MVDYFSDGRFRRARAVIGIAWQAHVGGFIVGGVLAWLLVTGLHAFRGKSLTWRTTVYGITVFVAIIVGCNAGNPLMHMSLLYQ